MGVRSLLLRVAARRPRVLVVGVPGWRGVRLAVEAELARRGWPVADSPADADVLVVAGRAGPELAGAVDAVWAQLPGPRARAVVTAAGAPVGTALDAAAAALRADAGTGGADVEPSGHPDIGMADTAGDRDGLALDATSLRLGPVLTDWPAGLVVDATLQGDVLSAASVQVWGVRPGQRGSAARPNTVDRRDPAARPDPGLPADPRARAVLDRLDAAGRLLSLAGAGDLAARARRLRDDVLTGVDPAALAGPLFRLARRVAGDPVLRWSLRGVPADPDGTADAHDRLLEWTTGAATGGPAASRRSGGARSPDALPGLLVGLDLAAARLAVAALDPDTDAGPPSRAARPTAGAGRNG